jgi:hypothetical protein
MMPTPFCYQTSVLKLLHNNLITHSRNLEEESPYKPDTFHLRLKVGTCPHFCPQTISKQNKVLKGRSISRKSSD